MGDNSRIRNLIIKKEVVRKLALGESQSQIGREIGVDRRTINGWIKNRDDIKELVEKEQIRLLDKVPNAVDYVSSLIPIPDENGNLPAMNYKEKELAYKASNDVLKAAGIMPSTVPSQIIMNIYQEKPLINPVIMQLLEERDKKFLPIGEVVDVKEEKEN